MGCRQNRLSYPQVWAERPIAQYRDPWTSCVMAEIALGGIQRTVAHRSRHGNECGHPITMSTITAGLERVVCEVCGHMSLRNLRSISGPIDRECFARPADAVPPPKLSAEQKRAIRNAAAVFAIEERLHVRGRYEIHPQPAAIPA